MPAPLSAMLGFPVCRNTVLSLFPHRWQMPKPQVPYLQRELDCEMRRLGPTCPRVSEKALPRRIRVREFAARVQDKGEGSPAVGSVLSTGPL